ncbi:MAG: transcription termination factor NusA [Phytoplasma sp.]|uniref:transcription termination factor NusA n=1 Tax=Phytoplasma sp. TaxID=2155 RepID=UPI002B400757|nr:transcription termination factor NusA [Phytoplasma sp.]WRH06729.1 MAG: transcription termination factor NusA [Phytoplasma sp.]
MKTKDFLNYIDQLSEEYELTREQTLEAFEKSLIFGCKKNFQIKSCHLVFKKEYQELFLYKEYLVIEPKKVDEISHEDDIDIKKITCITVEEATKFKKNPQVGEIIRIEVNPKDFSFYASKDFKNKFNEEIIKYKKENIYNFFQNYEHKLISAKVFSIKKNFCVLELEKEVQTVLFNKDKLSNDDFEIGERIQVYVLEVQKTTKMPKILVSRVCSNFVLEIFKEFIPEIQEGIIEIIVIARFPSVRVKVGLLSHNSSIDAIGSCIGENSTRIKNIINVLKGEKIDLFLWSDDPKALIANALQPAKVSQINILDLENKNVSVLVNENQVSLAIGKFGTNVQLAIKATKWNISIQVI